MATFYKRKGKRGTRWTARVRFAGREVTKTFGTKGAAETWARSQETAIEAGEFKRPAAGVIFAEEPRVEEYGTVVVFVDRFGNRWDLIQPT